VMLAAMATLLWTAISQGSLPWSNVGQEFFLTVAACWAVLIPAKFWTNHRGDAWVRRLAMMVLGIGIGFTSVWLEGWSPRFPASGTAYAAAPGSHSPLASHFDASIPNLAGHLSYFALAFFALRWWKLADRRRAHRFSFAPILAAGFWGLALLLVWQDPWRGTLVLTTAAAIVQLVSPWEQPPPPVNRRMRLRYA
jgi:hypothetical protein